MLSDVNASSYWLLCLYVDSGRREQLSNVSRESVFRATSIPNKDNSSMIECVDYSAVQRRYSKYLCFGNELDEEGYEVKRAEDE